MSRFWGVFFNVGLCDGGGGIDIVQMQIVDAQIQAHFVFFMQMATLRQHPSLFFFA